MVRDKVSLLGAEYPPEGSKAKTPRRKFYLFHISTVLEKNPQGFIMLLTGSGHVTSRAIV